MDNPEQIADFQRDAIAGLERRAYAAGIDMLAVAAGCFGVMQADGVLFPFRIHALGLPAMILLLILFLLEVFGGRSLGKLTMRLTVESETGGRVTLLQTILRAVLRWCAPLLALGSVLTHDIITASLLVGAAMVLFLCECPACYITFVRRNGTIFDLIAHTRVRVR